jgi:hypothetical protein
LQCCNCCLHPSPLQCNGRTGCCPPFSRLCPCSKRCACCSCCIALLFALLLLTPLAPAVQPNPSRLSPPRMSRRIPVRPLPSLATSWSPPPSRLSPLRLSCRLPFEPAPLFATSWVRYRCVLRPRPPVVGYLCARSPLLCTSPLSF